MRRLNLALSIVVGVLLGALILTPLIMANHPDHYAYVIPLDYSNISGTDVDRMMPIEVNALALLDLGVISTSTDDYLWTDPSENQVQGFAQDIEQNGVRWWSHVNVPASSTTTNFLFLGGPDVDDGFPVNHPDRNDAHLEVSDAASLDITNDLDVRIEAEFETADDMCGVLLDKTSSNLAFTSSGTSGYALYSFGNEASSGNFLPVAGFSSVTNQYWDFTPDFDMFICGVSSTLGSGISILRVVKGDLVNDAAFETRSTFPLIRGQGNLYTNFFDKAIFLEAGVQHRFYYTCTSSCNGSNTTTATSTAIGAWSVSGIQTHATYGAHRTPPGSYSGQLKLHYYDANDPLVGFMGRIDNTLLSSSAEVWNGTNDFTLRMTYSTPTIDLFVDAINVGAVVTAEDTIDTNGNDMIIGRYFNGFVSSVDVQASSTSVLNIPDFMPTRISEFQEGELANSWLWKGTITDDSASANDAIYFITADTTNFNITAGSPALQPTPTPAATPEVLAGILNGASVGNLQTPIPNVTPELPGGPEAPDPEHMQSEVYWGIMGFWLATILAGIFGRFLSEYVMAAVFIIVFGVIAAIAGEEFLAWNVALIGLGSTGIALTLNLGK